jgi:acyl-CoA synthetase (AMP-forming)/AMP-acid ligase II/acyl carrier protein
VTTVPIAAPTPFGTPDEDRTSAFSLAELAAHGERPALLTADDVITYADLAARVRSTAERLGPTRRLVLVAGANTVPAVVTYLAALTAGHAVLLGCGNDGHAFEALVARYDPDVIAGAEDGWQPLERREGTAHVLHPDLGLLLSTSGSTGSPKLVRLSHDSVRANAESIAEYLGIRDTDRAATTLPLHYCYGLSILHSHLVRGAGLVLTDLSVADSRFWDLLQRHRATTFPGVPHTFDLLDRIGFADFDLPSLRYITQAGGRLAPDRVVRFAELGQRNGWDLYVMYGQTEATARMAYLPPDLAAAHPGAIGRPVPGGALRVDAVPEVEQSGVGELVYTGRNVMLGYAEAPEDLARGRTIHELRTGDLARLTADGLFEVVGRLSRFAKIFGLRVDLQRVETALEEVGASVSCSGTDDVLVVVAEGALDPEHIRRCAATASGVPRHRVRVLSVAALPRLASGKPDHSAVAALATASQAPSSTERPSETGIDRAAAVRALYAELLDSPAVADDDTFVSLGGDSLSYVEVSVRLEELLGDLPADWHERSVRDLGAPGRPRRRWPQVETGVAVRAAAIIAIVGSHVELFAVLGGAHVLLALAGHSFGRFQLTHAPRRERRRHLLRSTARVALPSMFWIALVALLFGDLARSNLVLLSTALGPEEWGPHWHYWFVETVVQTLLVLGALLSVPLVERAERRWPFGLAVGMAGLGLLTRYDVVGVGGEDRIHTPLVVFWLFALGWATAKASTTAQRWVVTVLTLCTVPGFFGDPQRDAVVAGGLLLLVWVPTLPCPTALLRPVSVLASASLYIYLTHWQIYPLLERDHPWGALAASVALGLVYWIAWTQATAWCRFRSWRLRSDASARHGTAPAPAHPGWRTGQTRVTHG